MKTLTCLIACLTVASTTVTFTDAFSSVSRTSLPSFVRRTRTGEGVTKRNLSSQNDPIEIDHNPSSSSSSSTSESPEKQSLPELFPRLSSSLHKLKLSTPTPIQSASAPLLCCENPSNNALLIAPTGSGKTLAYLLPTLTRTLSPSSEGRRSSVLVVAPTRELAVQLARDATDLLSNLNDEATHSNNIHLAIRGIDPPSPQDLSPPPSSPPSPTILIGTPEELTQLLSTSRDGGIDFLAGDTLDTIILDEVDVLLPNPPKNLRTSLDRRRGGGGRRGDGKDRVREERRKTEAKRKRNAAKRRGTELDVGTGRLISPTETLLKLVASRRFASSSLSSVRVDADAAETTTTTTTTTPYRVVAGSATASRRTLENLNRVLRVAAEEGGSSSFRMVWDGDVVACRPAAAVPSAVEEDDATAAKGTTATANNNNIEGGNVSTTQNDDNDSSRYAIRAVTVPKEVNHRYITIQKKEDITSPTTILQQVAKASNQMKCETALLFLCGEFAKAKSDEKKKQIKAVRGATAKARRNKSFKQKKMEKIKASWERAPVVEALSARMACKILGENGIRAEPLHVALGLEESKTNNNDNENESDDEIPPFLVTFEGSARGLHFDGVDAVFIVGRPSSAASYLHLAGRVGRSVPTVADGSVGGGGGGVVDDDTVMVRPGTVVSIVRDSKELEKWTRQIGGTDLEELVLED